MLRSVSGRFIALGAIILLASGRAGCPRYCPGYGHKLDIERRFNTPEEQELISIAEAVYPPREDIINMIGHDSPDLPQEFLWWTGEIWGIRIPYAITGDAVEYYTSVILGLREDPRLPEVGPVFSSTFRYLAQVEYHDTYQQESEIFENVYVVTMHLGFGMHYGQCGVYYGTMGFSKHRNVVIAPDGEVLRVFGDGETRAIAT